ncbi:class I SAM-dependent methyltransferase, partial [Planomonospora parontospora]
MAIDHERPSRLHQALFGLLSLAAPRTQGKLLRRYFELWHTRSDPWKHGISAYEHHKYTATLQNLPDRDYQRILDVGCSEGTFTLLASAAYPQAQTVGVDISERALGKVRERCRQAGSGAQFVQLDILTETPGGRF